MSHRNLTLYFVETIVICTGSNVHWMNATLRSHFSINRHNLVNPANKHRTMEFIRDYMKNDLKLDIHLDTFTTPGDSNVGLKNYHRMLRRLSRRSCCPDSIILRYCCNRKYELRLIYHIQIWLNVRPWPYNLFGYWTLLYCVLFSIPILR